MNRQLIITGFHRSATSATAHYIESAGLDMGKDLLGAHISNPGGHFEDKQVVALHDEQLQQSGTSWQFHDETSIAPEKDFLKDYIQTRNSTSQHWGVKDPRIALFLETWQQSLSPNAHFLLITRHWSSCIESLLNRHSRSLAHQLLPAAPHHIHLEFWCSPELAAKMWLAYSKRILSFATNNPESSTLVTQRSIFQQAPLIETLVQRSGLNLDPSAPKPFNTTFLRDCASERVFTLIPQHLQDNLEQVWQQLLRLTTLKSDDETPITEPPEEVYSFNIYSNEPNTKDLAISKSSHGNWLQALASTLEEEACLKFLQTTPASEIINDNNHQWLNHVPPRFDTAPQVHLACAQLLLKARHFEKAKELFSWVITLGFSPPFIYLKIAECYRGLGNTRLEKFFTQIAIKRNPNNPFFFTYLAQILQSEGNDALAETNFKKAYEMAKGNPTCAIEYAKCIAQKERVAEAISIIENLPTERQNHIVKSTLISFQLKQNYQEGKQSYASYIKENLKNRNLTQWASSILQVIPDELAKIDLIQRCIKHWSELGLELSATPKPTQSKTPEKQTQPNFLGLITRCKDEYFIKEFVDYYLAEGVDKIYIIDDDSSDKEIYKDLADYSNVEIIYGKNIIKTNLASHTYKSIKDLYQWIIYLDVDEFISTKKNSNASIRDELFTTFSEVDCIKVPWVMMASNNIDKSPKRILHTNIWRWDHDKQHPHPVHKFRCRYDEIEVKCIFRTSAFNDIKDHHPIAPSNSSPKVVESINKLPSPLNPFHKKLRENCINNAHLVCYHYRIISNQNNLSKLKHNFWYIADKYDLNDLQSSDHNDLIDTSMSSKTNQSKIFIIGFNRCGTRTLHYFFQRNKLKCIHWDNDNLVKTMEANLKAQQPLLRYGKSVNTSVNDDCLYEKAHVFSDITMHSLNKDAKDYYQQLDIDYPGSKFILNIRDIEKWVASRFRHANGHIVKVLTKYHQCDKKQLENIWKEMWTQTIDEITTYFKSRPNDFLIYDIENDSIDKVCDFLSDKFQLDSSLYEIVK